MHHTTQNLKDMGKQVCLGLIINNDLEAPSTEEPQPLPEGETPQIKFFSKQSILEELKNNKELLQNNCNDSSSGSDSDPSEDNLDPEEIASVYPLTLTPKPKSEKKNSTSSNKKRVESNRSLTSQKDRNKVIPKCKLCGEPELAGHICLKPKPKLRAIMKPQTIPNITTQPYYNAAGKKVRDQATQTVQITTNNLIKTNEEQKTSFAENRNSVQISPIKKDTRVAYRTNSTDEASVIGKFWKNEKAFPGLNKNSRKGSAWKQNEILKK
jgi:ribosomal protein L32